MKLKKLTTLTIDVKRWVRGHNDETSLLNGRGKSCCLGFDCMAQGVPREACRNRSFPAHVPGYRPHRLVNFKGNNTRFTVRATSINDSTETSDAKKVRLLRAHYKKKGVRLRFTNKEYLR